MPQDITEKFTAAASALQLGELVKDEWFTLAESVGALEIMDPKMDSGFLEPGEKLEPDYDVAREISPEQAIGIMDELLCYEAAWHQGNPLAQTLFTCLYIDNLLWPEQKSFDGIVFRSKDSSVEPDGLVSVVLRAYCCGLIKACGFVYSQIVTENYYEDEDFSTHLYNRRLLDKVPAKEVQDALAEAQSYVVNAFMPSESVRAALIDRLHFRSCYLEALSLSLVADKVRIFESFQKMRESLAKIRESSQLGKSVSDAFSPKVQRKFVSSTPPRPSVKTSLTEAFEELEHLRQNAADAMGLLKCTTAGSIISYLLTFMSRNPQPSVYIRCLMQSLIYNISKESFLGKISPSDLIFTDLNTLVLGESILTDPENEIVEAPQNPRFAISECMHRFATVAKTAFVDLVRCLCTNRSRTRRLMAHTLSTWENLQFDAEDVDGELQKHTGEMPLIDRLSPGGEKLWSFPLSSWVYTYKLRQMEWIVQLGFELAVYLPDELPAMFWYLRYLSDVRAQHIHRVSTFAKRSYGHIDAPTKLQSKAFKRTLDVLKYNKDEASVVAIFSDCLGHLYRALIVLELLSVPPRPYSDPGLRHSLRMKPFLSISLPPVPSAEELEAGIETGVKLLSTTDDDVDASDVSNPASVKHPKAMSLLKMAEDSARLAKQGWDALVKHDAEPAQVDGCEDAWRKKNKDVLKSVIATGIAIASIKKAIDKAQQAGTDITREVEVLIPERGYHEWWPVPSIKSK